MHGEIDPEVIYTHRENLEKESRIMELRIRIMRTTELAAVEEKLHELERQKEEMLRFGSAASLLQRLQDIQEASHHLSKHSFILQLKQIHSVELIL
ncbi:hypothetical protein FEM48_Zijuj04G0056100 [Ziziphus jujuba var. spinosa]|uniref:Uncharacterized protein n=1 Tax=Ziziphus jujuba var. spinosa TaxID=714518 RepID=A0A978VI39_ZIZJJ|nr:hypothetical protein FEM48_Zijuj04G0056100 [Ziziphus jujuba var. spinosa]